MELRASLLPKKKKLKAIREKIELIEDTIVRKGLEAKELDALIEEFQAFTGKDFYDKAYFRDLHSAMSIEECAEEAATQAAEKVEDIKKEELIFIVEKIMEADDDANYYLNLLEKNVPHPQVSNLIFWPNELGYDLHHEFTAEEIVNIALSYKEEK